MTKHIKIKVLTRLPKNLENYHWSRYTIGSSYCEREQLELIDDIFYNVSWLNKHDTSLDKMFNNPLDQLDKISKSINSEYNVPTTKLGIR